MINKTSTPTRLTRRTKDTPTPSHSDRPRLRNSAPTLPEETDRRGCERRVEERRLTVTAEFTGAESRNTETPDRRKVERRRQIDPTTCERDYQPDQIEFMRAMDDYKRRSGRQFPTWSEVLEVLCDLGYRKVAEPTRTFN